MRKGNSRQLFGWGIGEKVTVVRVYIGKCAEKFHSSAYVYIEVFDPLHRP